MEKFPKTISMNDAHEIIPEKDATQILIIRENGEREWVFPVLRVEKEKLVDKP